jgi:hypothetical protein
MNEVSILLWSIESMPGKDISRKSTRNETGAHGVSYGFPNPYPFPPSVQQNIIHTIANKNVQIHTSQRSPIQQTLTNSAKISKSNNSQQNSPSNSGSETESTNSQSSGCESNTPPCVASDPHIGSVISRKRVRKT